MFSPGGPTFLELMRQAWSSTDEGYDLLAPKFDLTPFRTPTEVLEALRPFLAAQGEIPRALDLCCGTGAGVALLSPFAGEVVGVDRSEGMLAQGRQTHADLPNVRWLRADALALPFSGAFDLVTCFGAFGHILEQDEPAFVAEVARVLRPGGRFLFLTAPTPPWHSPGLWLARGFNAVMRVRNWLHRPQFVMYYLTFLLPRATALLEAAGLTVEVVDAGLPKPFGRLRLVVAQKA